MTDTEKIQLAEDLYNDPSTTQKEKVLLEKLFPEIKPVYFLEIPAGDVAPAEEDGPLEEDIFPESSESEEQPMDEKIRQYLIQMVNAIRADDFELSGLNKEDVLAYLERQKEQKPAEWSKGDKEKLIVDFLVSLGYPIDANGNIPNYNETFESCKSALVYWLQQNLQKMLANKRIEPDGIKTETLLKDSYIQAYREGIEDSIRELSSQCENSSSQPHWKPSEEQMKALKEATAKHWEPDGLHPLYTLYNDLQKLL